MFHPMVHSFHAMDLLIFSGSSFDYGLNSMGGSEEIPLKSESGKVSVMDYQWQSTIFRGCFCQLVNRSFSRLMIFWGTVCYVSSRTLLLTYSVKGCKSRPIIIKGSDILFISENLAKCGGTIVSTFGAQCYPQDVVLPFDPKCKY